jgi:hypothetical protein
MMVFIAALIAFLSSSIYSTGLSPFYFDPTPLVLTISGILILWSIFGYKLLDVMVQVLILIGFGVVTMAIAIPLFRKSMTR